MERKGGVITHATYATQLPQLIATPMARELANQTFLSHRLS